MAAGVLRGGGGGGPADLGIWNCNEKIVKNIPSPIFNHSQRARMGLNKKFGPQRFKIDMN